VTSRIALPDVNVLVALAWPNHRHHQAAVGWFTRESALGWATTPVTESGFVRVSSNRQALPAATSPVIAVDQLRLLSALPGHVFWPDTVRFVAADDVLPRLRGHRQVTDAHLVTLARHHGGVLVTFDQGLAGWGGDVVALLEPDGP